MTNMRLGTKYYKCAYRQDGAVVCVRHCGTYVRVHHSRLIKADAQQTVLEIQQEVTKKQMLQDFRLNHEDDDTEFVEETDMYADLMVSEIMLQPLFVHLRMGRMHVLT